MKLRNTIFIVEAEDRGFIPALNRLMSQQLPIEVAYDLSKLGREISERQKDFENGRMAILEKYGKQKDGAWEILAKNQEKANEEFNKLANMQEKYELKEKIKLPEDIEMSARDMLYLDAIIEVKK